MPKQIECRILDSRPLVPCRALSHRQPDNCRRDYYSKPSRPTFRDAGGADTGVYCQEPKKIIPTQNPYPWGLLLDVLA